ncbi:DUF808 domain-containing protein [Tessaracoccus rhinocerotis]|uniref:DUF808 domain-containing protein n=1 Tax=Tessaracoccus rhinocerotis TaxID=1689449 RepID=A0A553JY86_9ACTN|nr:DUF808 domain-containing protein [Tessaracoccus rhinocerotis]TRY17404.1 DUF808 domain-containing protein [Tessaracoccus rhinocerotis]
MAGGLAALLDDIAALARLAAASVDDVAAGAMKASAKAAGVVVDDAAVTPRFVAGVSPKRELPIIRKIAVGSLRNKLIFILPAILLMSAFLPWLLTPLLMLGGTYLCYEGAEKVWELLSGHKGEDKAPALVKGEDAEKKVISGAITTDFILSAEIMVISLNEVATEPLLSRSVILVVVALAITALVYGAVALIVKMDDIGLALTKRDSERSQALGRGLVAAMPVVLKVISFVGIFAMIWVGGHIILAGLDTLGWHAPYEFVHHLEGLVAGVPVVGGFLAWLVNTLCSMVLGIVWGGVVVAVLHFLPFGKSHDDDVVVVGAEKTEAGDIAAKVVERAPRSGSPDSH